MNRIEKGTAFAVPFVNIDRVWKKNIEICDHTCLSYALEKD